MNTYKTYRPVSSCCGFNIYNVVGRVVIKPYNLFDTYRKIYWMQLLQQLKPGLRIKIATLEALGSLQSKQLN